MQESYQGALAVIGSVTQAMRAQKILANAAIRVEVVKTDNGRGRGGCVYALSYAPTQEKNVRTILQNAGVRVREWIGDGT